MKQEQTRTIPKDIDLRFMLYKGMTFRNFLPAALLFCTDVFLCVTTGNLATLPVVTVISVILLTVKTEIVKSVTVWEYLNSMAVYFIRGHVVFRKGFETDDKTIHREK